MTPADTEGGVAAGAPGPAGAALSAPTRPLSLYRRLMAGFSAVILGVALLGLVWVVFDANAKQRLRTASENRAHAREMMMQLVLLAPTPERIAPAVQALEAVRERMFRELDYHSHVRVRVWQHGRLLINTQPALPELLPAEGSPSVGHVNTWVTQVERDPPTGIVVERSHEVDDHWMLTIDGVTFLLSSSVFSLPFLLLPAWLIVGIGLRPLRQFAQAIAQRADADLTPLPPSPYRELSPLVQAINQLMARLRQRIEHEHEFLSDAAHELKTPLAAIRIHAHLLQSRPGAEAGEGSVSAAGTYTDTGTSAGSGSTERDAPTRAARDAQVQAGLREAVERATHIVHQLLALERARAEPQAEALPVVALDTLVRDRLAAVAPLALQRDVELEFQAEAACERPAHVESLAALVDNLVINAIRYSPPGGRVSVHLGPRDGGGCRLQISDQGPGIPPAWRLKVFERFWRAPGQDQTGSGLGLAIAERAAARHGGVIRLGAPETGTGLVVQVDFGPAG